MDPIQTLNDYLTSIGRGPFVFFGPDANCTLVLCSPEWSVYSYRPALGVNIALLAFFFAALVLHIVMGAKWHTWSFTACMAAGCLDEMLGYAGRVWMFYDLWNFNAFMIQVVCITTAPVFYCAAIYVVLANTITTFAPALSRFHHAPLFYWIFIACDLVSLLLQGAGGALSALSSGLSHKGVNIALAGLILQVTTLLLFCSVYLDFLWRYHRTGTTKAGAATAAATGGPGVRRHHAPRPQEQRETCRVGLGARWKVFHGFEWLAVLAILARCVFRGHELSDGYSGPLVRREGLFIGLEGVLIVVAAFALTVGHPGLLLRCSQPECAQSQRRKESIAATSVDSGYREAQDW